MKTFKDAQATDPVLSEIKTAFLKPSPMDVDDEGHQLSYVSYKINHSRSREKSQVPEDPSKLKTPMRMEDNQKHAEQKHDEVGEGDHLLINQSL